MTTDADTPGLGHNLPQIPEAAVVADLLRDEYQSLIARRDELLDAFARFEASGAVEDAERLRKSTDFVAQLQALVKAADKGHDGAKAPWLAGGRTVDNFFKAISEPISKAKRVVEQRMNVYQVAVAAEERRKREEEQRQARAKADADRAAAEKLIEAAKTEDDLSAAVELDQKAKGSEQHAAQAHKAAVAKPAELARERGDLAVSTLIERVVHDEDSLNRATLNLEALRQHIPIQALHTAVRSYIKAGGMELAGVIIRTVEQTRVT